MPSPPRRPGPDSTLDQVRADLVEAGTKLLRERGAELGLGNVTLSDAIAECGASRSTAYRSLAHDELAPQAVLHRDILTHLLTRFGRTITREAIIGVISDELERHDATITKGTVAQRTAALRSIIRVGANTSYQNVVASPERSILTAMYGALRSSPDPADWRHDALVEGERALNDMFSSLYTDMAGMFHYRVRPPFTMDQLTAAGASLVEGIAMRDGFNTQVGSIDRPTGPDETMESWTLFAVAFEALFMGLCEPDDPDDPFADLTSY